MLQREMYKNCIKIISVLALIMFSLSFGIFQGQAKGVSSDKYSFQVTLTQQGEPDSNASINYENTQVAYDNIRGGIIPNSLNNTVLWHSSVSESGEQTFLDLGNNKRVGVGIKHTDEEAKQIIKILFESNFDILQYLNGTENEYNSNSINSLDTLSSPGNKAILRTDNDGVGMGKSLSGLVAIINGTSLVDFIKLSKDNQIFKVDLDGMGRSLKFEFINLENSSDAAKSPYVVENNQKIDYKITISKKVLAESGTTLRILLPPNVLMGETSIPFQETSIIPQTIPESSYQGLTITKENAKLLQSQLSSMVGESLKNSWSKAYDCALPQSDTDIIITGTLSVTPSVKIDVNFLLDDTSILKLPIQLDSFDILESSNIKSPSTFQMAAQVENSQVYSSVNSPYLTSGGINFVTIDGEKNKLSRGGKYVLGKKIGDKYYIYSPYGWGEVSEKDLKNIEPSNYVIMSGGNTYNLGDFNAIPLTINPNNWNKDFKQLSFSNKSLIEVRGLGEGEQYFMMQVTPPYGYKKLNNLNYFEVYNQQGSSNLKSNSIGFAKTQSYGINGEIPGYIAGNNEYNVLSVTSKVNVSTDVVKKIILPIGMIILGILLIAFFLGTFI